jgi:hypothetical protein
LLALAPEVFLVSTASPSVWILLFASLLSCAVAVGLGVFTAIRATSGDVRQGLGEGRHGRAGSSSSQRIGRGIVAGQIAITLILVIGAGLLCRSLMKVLEVDPGFRVDKIVTMDISLPGFDWTDSKTKAAQATFFADLIHRLTRVPGVRKVGATSGLPLNGGLPDGIFLQDEVPKNVNNIESLARQFEILSRQKERLGSADFCVATDGYFQALGLPLLRGRIFDERDGPILRMSHCAT